MAGTPREIPSVDRVLREVGATDLPRPVLLAVVRRELAEIRNARRDGREPADPFERVRSALEELRLRRVKPVINATGVIIHTNLGRSPLAPGAVEAVTRTAAGYCNLEYDLASGERGKRADYVRHALAVLCDTDAALVVNNCAAALVLILRHYATGDRSEVLVSRGELIQIGGGFRVPEILEASGAVLREVGTTNRTSIGDYARAIGDRTALILRVHRSNFFMEGFVESAAPAELAALAGLHGVPFVDDLGSGATFDTGTIGPEQERTPRQAVADGADLVCFSGDKLFGGPQAGVIVGGRGYVDSLESSPLYRALRCDKLVLAALEATVDQHLFRSIPKVPVLAMIRAATDELTARAERIVSLVGGLPAAITVGEGESRVGGGALPQTLVPSVTVDVRPFDVSPDTFAERLRLGNPAVAGYIAGGCVRLDVRTVFPHEDDALAAAVRAALLDSPASERPEGVTR